MQYLDFTFYIITCQLRHPAGRMAVSFTVKPFIDALKCAESFVNEWLENKSSPCRVKILLTEQDMNNVYQLYTGFLDSCSRPPEPANFPEFSPDRLLVAILYDASASYRQSVVDEALRKYDLVVTAVVKGY